jgi:hypothetical protein
MSSNRDAVGSAGTSASAHELDDAGRRARAVSRTTAAIDQGDAAMICAALSETATLMPGPMARDFVALIELAWYDVGLVALQWAKLQARLPASRRPST